GGPWPRGARRGGPVRDALGSVARPRQAVVVRLPSGRSGPRVPRSVRLLVRLPVGPRPRGATRLARGTPGTWVRPGGAPLLPVRLGLVPSGGARRRGARSLGVRLHVRLPGPLVPTGCPS